MMDRINLIAIFGSIFLLLIILELVRRRYLSERYSLVWILTGIAFLILSIKIDLLRSLSKFLGFSVPSNALFFFGILFLILIVLSFSVILSRLSEKNKVLTQEIVLLKKRIEDIEKSHPRKSS
ncbi:MAG: DUF2304 domain-containing protein [Thermodesulfobacteriota bacterium]